ncbi:MAG: hypothetical protein D6731_14415 [Planctomycetota bacterium]|nr:MAG: hypothetical protein D6731_14415 [Planctomycetota bacterium]
MRERRKDPRTDAGFSLQNLLRVRAARAGCALAALATEEGVVMAATHDGRAAQRAAAHAALGLASGRRREWRGARTGAGMAALRFECQGRRLCLALVGAGPPDFAALESMAERVRAILAEARGRRAA